MKEIKRKFRYLVDNPALRELVAFFKRSEGKPLDEEFRVAAIEGLVANQDWTSDKIETADGKELARFVEYIRQRATANDRGFFIRLGRALVDREREKRKRKKPKHKNLYIEHFLFKYWDRTVSDDLGLKHFTDQAVVEFLEIKFVDQRHHLRRIARLRNPLDSYPRGRRRLSRWKSVTDLGTLTRGGKSGENPYGGPRPRFANGVIASRRYAKRR